MPSAGLWFRVAEVSALRLYLRFIGVSVKSQMQYRVSFVLLSMGQFVITSIEIIGIWALFQRFGELVPWSLAQVAFFYGVVNVSFALTDAASRGFDLFGTEFVKTGNFDRLLVRPRSTVLQVAGHEFPLFRVGRLAQGLVVMIWAGTSLDLNWGVNEVLLLAVTLAATFVFFYALIICQAVLSFWTTESLEIMNTLTYGGVETAQYPMAIYHRWFRRFFTFVVPLACVSYFPVLAILQVDDPLGSTRAQQMAAPLAGFAFFGLSLLLWRFGVRRYTSTGS
jgi:ABC-2 type transport system permease protein